MCQGTEEFWHFLHLHHEVMSIAVTCQASRSSALVHKLLSQSSISADTHAKFQLFSQELENIDTKFTAF